MTEQEVYTQLTDIFRELFADDAIVLTAQTSADDIDGWDSFIHLSLVVGVETRFGIKFRTSEIDSLSNVGALVERIIARV